MKTTWIQIRPVLRAISKNYENKAILENANGDVEVSWTKSDNSISIKLQVPTKKESWIGIGWGGDDNMMTNADMVCASKNGDSWVVLDYFSTGYEKPNPDEIQSIYDTSAGYSDGQSWMKFSRNISTSDSTKDHPIHSGQFELAFAVGYSGKFSAHKYAGHKPIEFFKETASDDDDDDEKIPATPVFKNNEYFSRAFGSCLPEEQEEYEIKPGYFGNFMVERAKHEIDAYYKNKTSRKSRDPLKMISLYHIAECKLQKVEHYAEEGSYVFPAPCIHSDLPIKISTEYTPCDNDTGN